MSSALTTTLYLAVMVAVIIGVDVAFFRQHLWQRLAVNVGIVLVFGAFYFWVIGHARLPWR